MTRRGDRTRLALALALCLAGCPRIVLAPQPAPVVVETPDAELDLFEEGVTADLAVWAAESGAGCPHLTDLRMCEGWDSEMEALR